MGADPRRDSKAGLSFIHVHDGSCFDAIQVVAPAQLRNYESESAQDHAQGAP
jgi:asparaginyl-tRNA synthetase